GRDLRDAGGEGCRGSLAVDGGKVLQQPLVRRPRHRVANLWIEHQIDIQRVVVKGDLDNGGIEFAANVGVIDLSELEGGAIAGGTRTSIMPVVLELAVLGRQVVVEFLAKRLSEQELIGGGGIGVVVAVVESQHTTSAISSGVRVEADHHAVRERS